MAYEPPDMSSLAAELVVMTMQDNAEARLAGVDKNGNVLVGIEEETVRRRARRGDGEGPPLAPNETASRVVTEFFVTPEEVGPLHWRFVCSWPMPWLTYHTQGSGRNKVRDIVGIRPELAEKINSLVSAWIDNNL